MSGQGEGRRAQQGQCKGQEKAVHIAKVMTRIWLDLPFLILVLRCVAPVTPDALILPGLLFQVGNAISHDNDGVVVVVQ